MKSKVIDKLFVSLTPGQREILWGMMATLGQAELISRDYFQIKSPKKNSITEPVGIAADEPCSLIEDDDLANKVYDDEGVVHKVLGLMVDLVKDLEV